MEKTNFGVFVQALITNPASNRYVYPVCPICLGLPIIPYPELLSSAPPIGGINCQPPAWKEGQASLSLQGLDAPTFVHGLSRRRWKNLLIDG